MSSPEDEFSRLSLRSRMPTRRSGGGQSEESSDSDSGSDNRRQATLSFRREREIHALDILSSFDQTALPSSFRTDEQSTLSTPRSPNACVVQLDLQATILRLAVNIPAFFSVLRAAQPPASCAEIFFQKVHRKGTQTFQDWDIYCLYGPRGSQLRQTRASSASTPTHTLTIDWLVTTFRATSRLIAQQIRFRRPYGSQAAADCILYILGEVILHRNRDAFADNNWGRRPGTNENINDRNVFYQLIVASWDEGDKDSTSSSSNQDSDSDDAGSAGARQEEYYFGLSALEAIPLSILRERLQQLASMRERLDRYRAPLGYRRRFFRIMERARTSGAAQQQQQQQQQSQGQHQQGGLKRPAPGNGGGDAASGSSSSVRRGTGGRRYR